MDASNGRQGAGMKSFCDSSTSYYGGRPLLIVSASYGLNACSFHSIGMHEFISDY